MWWVWSDSRQPTGQCQLGMGSTFSAQTPPFCHCAATASHAGPHADQARAPVSSPLHVVLELRAGQHRGQRALGTGAGRDGQRVQRAVRAARDRRGRVQQQRHARGAVRLAGGAAAAMRVGGVEQSSRARWGAAHPSCIPVRGDHRLGSSGRPPLPPRGAARVLRMRRRSAALASGRSGRSAAARHQARWGYGQGAATTHRRTPALTVRHPREPARCPE